MMGDCKVECCDQYHEDEDEDANDEEDEDDEEDEEEHDERNEDQDEDDNPAPRWNGTLQGPKTHPFQERLI